MSELNRRQFLEHSGASLAGTLPVVGALAANAGQSQAAAPASQPNLLFVLADQWRFSAFGHGSDEVVRTPHIDRLANEGRSFNGPMQRTPSVRRIAPAC